ncbi:DDE-type integrase/transposase/recombinase, partial [Bacillus cereus]
FFMFSNGKHVFGMPFFLIKLSSYELVLKALQQAYFRQKPEDSVLHHSDRGSQYASHDYQKQLQQYGMQCSMSRKGNCYDNACIGSFHGVLKKELIYQQ